MVMLDVSMKAQVLLIKLLFSADSSSSGKVIHEVSFRASLLAPRVVILRRHMNCANLSRFATDYFADSYAVLYAELRFSELRKLHERALALACVCDFRPEPTEAQAGASWGSDWSQPGARVLAGAGRGSNRIPPGFKLEPARLHQETIVSSVH